MKTKLRLVILLILLIPFTSAFAYETLDQLKAEAQNGNVEAQTKLGYKYLYGEVKDINYGEAFRLLKAAAEANPPSLEAIVGLGFCYQNGYGTSIDIQKATELYEKAANEGLVSAYISLGYLKETQKDYTAALYWAKKAADEGDETGWHNMAVYYRDGLGCTKDLNKAAEMFEKSAELGYNESIYQLGWVYGELGDIEQSKKWYLRAANNLNSKAFFQLGSHYFREYKATRNPKAASQAISYYYEGVKYLNTAEISLKSLYIASEKGLEPGKNFKSSIKEYEKMAKNGDRLALKILFLYYISGITGEIELDKGIDCLIKYGSQFDNDEAYFELGATYYDKTFKFSKNDVKRAIYWFKESANLGNKSAMYNLGVIYSNDYKDYKSSTHWFEKCNEDLNAINEKVVRNSIILLANHYYEGENTERNLKLAAEKYKLLIDNQDKYYDPAILGYAYAMYAQCMYEMGSPTAFEALNRALKCPSVIRQLKGDLLRNLSACYSFGRYGAPKDTKKGDELFKEAIKYGYVKGQIAEMSERNATLIH